MFYLAYNILSLFLLIPVLFFTVYRSFTHKWPLAMAERFGLIPARRLRTLQNRPVIWLHAVSVGEVIAARPLIRAIRATYPAHAIVVSCGTDTGKQTASDFSETDLCIYLPFDFLPSIRHILNLIKPLLVIVMETEIWPNFSREVSRRRIPLLLANGRISDRSFPRYQKLRWFFRQPLAHFTALCMQSETARSRIIAIGAPSERVLVAGNLKYDIPLRQLSPGARSAMRQQNGIPADFTVLTAGSTHHNEEEMILTAYRQLLAECRGLFLVLAPRHPQRSTDVALLLRKGGFHFQRFSELTSVDREWFKSGDVLLVDTVGELMNFYAVADLVFVGGSLVPVGGHNLLEPASAGVPAIFGPNMANFREISALVLQSNAGIQIADSHNLAETLRRLVVDPEERRLLGANSLAMMEENGGATERHMQIIAASL